MTTILNLIKNHKKDRRESNISDAQIPSYSEKGAHNQESSSLNLLVSVAIKGIVTSEVIQAARFQVLPRRLPLSGLSDIVPIDAQLRVLPLQ